MASLVIAVPGLSSSDEWYESSDGYYFKSHWRLTEMKLDRCHGVSRGLGETDRDA